MFHNNTTSIESALISLKIIIQQFIYLSYFNICLMRLQKYRYIKRLLQNEKKYMFTIISK